MRECERAVELDPRNPSMLETLGGIYTNMRAYRQAEAAYDRAISIKPDDVDARLSRAALYVAWRADFRPMKAIQKDILVHDPSLEEERAIVGICVAYDGRDFAAAERFLATVGENWGFELGSVVLHRNFFEGWVARMKGDEAGARLSYNAARAQQEKVVRESPEFGPALCALGMIDAKLGRSEDALREGRRAMELSPLAKNALDAADVLYCFAMICAWAGQHDLALAQLAKIPAGPSYGDLRLDPAWDSLRGDLRFQKIVASLAPKEVAFR